MEFIILVIGWRRVQASRLFLAIQFRKCGRKVLERTTDDGDVVVMFEIADECRLSGEVLEILAEVLPATAPPLVMLEQLARSPRIGCWSSRPTAHHRQRFWANESHGPRGCLHGSRDAR